MHSKNPSRMRRLLWFIGLWAAGVGTLSVVAFLLRSVIKAISG